MLALKTFILLKFGSVVKNRKDNVRIYCTSTNYWNIGQGKMLLAKVFAVNANNLPSINVDVCVLMLKMKELKNVVDELKKIQVNILTAGSTSLIDTHHLVSDEVENSSHAMTLQVKQHQSSNAEIAIKRSW